MTRTTEKDTKDDSRRIMRTATEAMSCKMSMKITKNKEGNNQNKKKTPAVPLVIRHYSYRSQLFHRLIKFFVEACRYSNNFCSDDNDNSSHKIKFIQLLILGKN